MRELTTMINIGKVMAEKLKAVDIKSAEELRSVGAEEAWRRLREKDDSFIYKHILALESAITSIKIKELPEVRRIALKEYFNQYNK